MLKSFKDNVLERCTFQRNMLYHTQLLNPLIPFQINAVEYEIDLFLHSLSYRKHTGSFFISRMNQLVLSRDILVALYSWNYMGIAQIHIVVNTQNCRVLKPILLTITDVKVFFYFCVVIMHRQRPDYVRFAFKCLYISKLLYCRNSEVSVIFSPHKNCFFFLL
jgi:hypothetical protein